MSIVEHIPAIVRVIMVFILVLICIRIKLSLGNAFLLGAIFLSVLFGLKPPAMLKSMAASIIDPKTLSIAGIVSLILILSNSMEMAGQMQRLLDKFRGLVSSPRLNLAILPALIGLLPMPGGAAFSAPMVKELGVQSKLSGAQLSFVNYWFRHIWEHWWPLYPGVLLTTVITDLSLPFIMLLMFPFTIIAVWLGYRALKNSELNREVNVSNQSSPLKPFLKELVPIIIAIVPGLAMGIIFSTVSPTFPISKQLGLILALCMAIGWVWYVNGTSKSGIWLTLRNPRLLKMMYMIAAILIFKGILASSHAADAVGRELVQMHVPLILIAVALPFLVGMSSGIVIAFVGSTLPILIPLIHSFGEAAFLPAYVMLILAGGFTGILLSPLHLCFLLSNEHFDVSMGSVYKYLWWPCVLQLAASMIYFGALHWLHPWM
jgi:integral membrane protein (TIGR00529 family)